MYTQVLDLDPDDEGGLVKKRGVLRWDKRKKKFIKVKKEKEKRKKEKKERCTPLG